MKNLPSPCTDLPRALVIQLARLGDLLQSLPAISAIRSKTPPISLDLLCPSPLVSLGKLFPGIARTLSWDGEEWHALAMSWNGSPNQSLSRALRYFSHYYSAQYPLAYNLNNHPRSILASYLLGTRVVGAGDEGPLNVQRPPWVEYLRHVAQERGPNRVHLADAFCGLCGVRPPENAPTIEARDIELAHDLQQIVGDPSLGKIGIVIGAGDVDRRVPLATWRRLIECCIDHIPHSLCVLIGGTGEREAALVLEDQLSPHYLSRIFNCVGRTTLPQLAHVFNECQWVVGSDTGPLHLGVACGARAVGWYFSRARVHETGPYGEGHYVWQHQGNKEPENWNASRVRYQHGAPNSWPIVETVQLMLDEQVSTCSKEWDLWMSKRDEWGMFYSNGETRDNSISSRAGIWKRLSGTQSPPAGSSISHTISTG